MIDHNSFEKVQGYIELGKREHHLAFQAQLPAGLEGYYVAPAIFDSVEPAARLAQEEIFGPVLALITAKDLSTAIQIANNTPFALTGGLYSRSPQNIERVTVRVYGRKPLHQSLDHRRNSRTTSIWRIQNVRRRNESRREGIPAQFPVSARRHRKTLRHGYAPETPTEAES